MHDGMVWVTLTDRRVIGMPLDFFPWLEPATPEKQARYDYRRSVSTGQTWKTGSTWKP
jgi:hypothetical protein